VVRPIPVRWMTKSLPPCTGFEKVTNSPFLARATVAIPVSNPANQLQRAVAADAGHARSKGRRGRVAEQLQLARRR